MNAFDVQVHGTGIVGHSLALALARLGLRVALANDAGAPGRSEDVRAYALNPASVDLLRTARIGRFGLAAITMFSRRTSESRGLSAWIVLIEPSWPVFMA